MRITLYILLILGIFRKDTYLKQFWDRDLPNFSDIGRARTHCFLKLAPLTHTHKHRPDYFFQRPTSGNIREKAFSAKAFKLFYCTILNEVDCNMFSATWHVPMARGT